MANTRLRVNTYIGKEKKSQRNNLSSHLKIPEKEKQNKPRASKRKETVKVRLEKNELKTEKK